MQKGKKILPCLLTVIYTCADHFPRCASKRITSSALLAMVSPASDTAWAAARLNAPAAYHDGRRTAGILLTYLGWCLVLLLFSLISGPLPCRRLLQVLHCVPQQLSPCWGWLPFLIVLLSLISCIFPLIVLHSLARCCMYLIAFPKHDLVLNSTGHAVR